MADDTFRTVLPALKAVDNGDGTYSVAVSFPGMPPLTGLTAGELLVATAATTAAWQNSGVILTAPDISGVVTAAAPLSLPAYTLLGKLTAGAVEIEGSAFDINGGTMAGVTLDGGLDCNGQVLTNVAQITADAANRQFRTAALDDADWDFTAVNTASATQIVASFRAKNVIADSRFELAYGKLTGALFLNGQAFSGAALFDTDITFNTSVDSALVADEVSLGGYEIAAGQRSLAISQENPVVNAAAGASDNYLPVRINGATFKLLLHS